MPWGALSCEVLPIVSGTRNRRLAHFAILVFLNIIEDRVSLFQLLFGFGFDHLAQPKAHAIQHLGHGTGRGQLVRAIALGAERVQGLLRRQPCVGRPSSCETWGLVAHALRRAAAALQPPAAAALPSVCGR